MPGIYINDGGAMSSGLGSALGRMANAFTPEAQAQAALLYQQTLQEMWKNRLSQATVPATEQGIAAQRALPGLVGASVGSYGYTPPTGPQSPSGGPLPGTGGTATYSAGGGVGAGPGPGVGRPPPAPEGSPANTSQDSMSQGGEAYKGATNSYQSGQTGAQQHDAIGDILGMYAAGGKGVQDLLPLITFGQNTNRGPGMSTADQTEIARTRVAPFNQAPGERRVDPYGQAGIPLPGLATSGPQRAVAGLTGAQPSFQAQPPTQQPGQPTQTVYDGTVQPAQPGQPMGRTGYMQPVGPQPSTPPMTGAAQPGQPVQPALQPGQIPGQSAPGVWEGPSVYGVTAQKAQADADTALFNKLGTEGWQAPQELQNISDLRRLHDLVGTATLPSRVLSAVDRELLDRYGISLGTPGAAMADINKRVAEMISQVHDQFGTGRVSAASMNIMKQSLPNAQMDPRTFHDVMDNLEAAANQKRDAGIYARMAIDGKISPSQARDQISQVYANNPVEAIRAQHPNLFGEGVSAPANAPTGRTIGGAPTPQAAPAPAAAPATAAAPTAPQTPMPVGHTITTPQGYTIRRLQ